LFFNNPGNLRLVTSSPTKKRYFNGPLSLFQLGEQAMAATVFAKFVVNLDNMTA
jgi:hypothetical protein